MREGFKNFLTEKEEKEEFSFYPIEILTESKNSVTFDHLLQNTDAFRLRRAIQEVRTNPPIAQPYSDGSEKLEFNFKSFPSKEMKRHKGFIIHKEGVIERVYCDCKDFFYRLMTPLVEAGLARYELSSKYNTEFAASHNKEWTKISNPEGRLFICKHVAALKDYIK